MNASQAHEVHEDSIRRLGDSIVESAWETLSWSPGDSIMESGRLYHETLSWSPGDSIWQQPLQRKLKGLFNNIMLSREISAVCNDSSSAAKENLLLKYSQGNRDIFSRNYS